MESKTITRSRAAVIGIVGDRRGPGDKLQLFTESALMHVPEPMPFEWIPTLEIAENPGNRVSHYAALLISPSTSPYDSVEGVLAAIRYGRENRVPVFGACGGFQHIVLELVRDVLGFTDAEHAEANPSASRLAVTPLSCSFAGQDQPVRLGAGSKVAGLCGTETVVEPFFCNYGLNPEYQAMLESRGMVVSGLGDDGVVRAMELQDHPFFLATLYVPQARSQSGAPHPLITGFVAAAHLRWAGCQS